MCIRVPITPGLITPLGESRPSLSQTNKPINLHYRVCYLAGEFARHLQIQLLRDSESKVVKDEPDWKSLCVFEDNEVLCVQIAGLCHDLGKTRSVK